jgi:hypothetical protein
MPMPMPTPTLMLRCAPLLTLLLACAPGKQDSDDDASGADVTTTTIGHSSAAPIDPDPEPMLPTSSVSETSPTTPTSATTNPTMPDPPGDTITTTSTTSFPDPTSAPDDTATDPEGVPISPQETTVAFIVFPPDLPPGACNPWQEDCPEGQKCMPFATPGSPTWNAVKCVPIAEDAGPAGAVCTVADTPTSGLDDCQQHSMCWDVDADLHGTCVGMCNGDGLDHFCLDADNRCMVANGGVILVCVPRCDPLLADCPEGQVCVPNAADFACAPDASGNGGQMFAPCEAGNTCDPGLVCASSEHSSQCQGDADECCLPFCDVDEPGGCPPGHACTKWFPDGGVEPDLLDVGLCATP